MTVGQVLDTLCPCEVVTVFFDQDNKLEFENGDFMLNAFRDFVVGSMSCYKLKDPSVAGLQLNIKMIHEPVRATA